MDELKGWIALYRAIIDNEFLWSDTPFARGQSWIDLLLLANHKTKCLFAIKNSKQLHKRKG